MGNVRYDESILVSVIIVTKDRKQQVLKAISSVKKVLRGLYSYEIIVADNNDNNDTAEEIHLLHDDVIVLSMGQNKGVSIPRNKAAQISQGKYLYFLDDDAWVEDDFLSGCLNVFDKRNDVFAVSSFTRYFDKTGKIIENIYNWPSLHLTLRPNENGVLIRKEIFLELGGFNELLFFGVEGEDLCLKAFYKDYLWVRTMDSNICHPTIADKKEKNDVQRIKLCLKARCISARTTWPTFFAVIRIVRAMCVTSVMEAVHFKSLRLFWNILGDLFEVMRGDYTKLSIISWKKFRKFRKLAKCEMIEIHL